MTEPVPVGQGLLDEVLVAVLALCVVLAVLVIVSRVRIQRRTATNRERLAPLRQDLLAVGAGEDESGDARRRLVDDRVAGPVLDRAVVDLLTKVRGGPADDLVSILRKRHGVTAALGSLGAASSVRRARATRTLGLLRDPALTSDIVRMLDDRSSEVRIVAARAVGAIGPRAGASAASAVLRAVRTRRSGPGVPATVAMGTLTQLGVESESAVTLGLEDADPGVRNVAAAVAGHSLFLGCAPRLTLLAATDSDRTVRVSATEALGAVGRPDDVPAIARLLAPHEPPTVRRAAARALGELGGREAVAVLVSVLADALDESRVVLVPPVSRESITQGLWLSGRLLESADLAHDELRAWPFIQSLEEQLPVGALLGTPLGVGEGVIGAMLLIAPEPRRWTSDERTALQQGTAYAARSFLAAERGAQQAVHVARLESLDRQKDEFVGTVSHELRTPLTSIAGYLEMLTDGDLGELTPAQLKALAVIDRNTVRLRGLIEDVLVLNRIETRGLDPSFVPVDIGALVADVVQDLQPQAAGNDVTLEVLAAPGSCVVGGDPLQLGRALTNVIGNAVKFSRTGGTVSVAAVVEATRVRIQCRDEGIGIPEADMERMFSRFFRASNATAKAIPGTGLGLAIVKAIVEAHHGELELHSVEGEGTTVVMVLPLTSPGTEASAAD